MIDDGDEPVVEVRVRVAELLVGLLEQRVVAAVERRERVHVDPFGERDQGFVTGVVRRCDAQRVVVAVDDELAGNGLHRSLLHRQPITREVVDRDDDASDEALRLEMTRDGVGRQQRAELAQELGIARLQGRQRGVGIGFDRMRELGFGLSLIGSRGFVGRQRQRLAQTLGRLLHELGERRRVRLQHAPGDIAGARQQQHRNEDLRDRVHAPLPLRRRSTGEGRARPSLARSHRVQFGASDSALKSYCAGGAGLTSDRVVPGGSRLRPLRS